jgi:hypothetical protein
MTISVRGAVHLYPIDISDVSRRSKYCLTFCITANFSFCARFLFSLCSLRIRSQYGFEKSVCECAAGCGGKVKRRIVFTDFFEHRHMSESDTHTASLLTSTTTTVEYHLGDKLIMAAHPPNLFL